MTDFIDNIAVDLDIYNKWPDEIKYSWAGVYQEDGIDISLLYIIQTEEFLPRTVQKLDRLPDMENVVAYISWFNDEINVSVSALYVNPDFRENGIGKFICILARTWVAENLGLKIYASTYSRTAEVESILLNIALEYNEDTLVVKTNDGEYKEFSEVDKETEI